MSCLIARPEAGAAAACRLTGRGSAIATAVSASTAIQFSAHVVTQQTVGAQPMTVHELGTAILRAGVSSYAATVTANTLATSAARG